MQYGVETRNFPSGYACNWCTKRRVRGLNPLYRMFKGLCYSYTYSVGLYDLVSLKLLYVSNSQSMMNFRVA